MVSERIFFTGAYDSDAVVGELVMGTRNFSLWHMTGNAICLAHFTEFGSGFGAGVAGGTFGIVKFRFPAHWNVRIVTGYAGDSLIIGIALRIENSVGLEPDIIQAT